MHNYTLNFSILRPFTITVLITLTIIIACVFLYTAGFMAYVEKDAKQRSEAKKKEIKHSDHLKRMGNGEYRKGNYEKALIYYNQVSEMHKNFTIALVIKYFQRTKLFIGTHYV